MALTFLQVSAFFVYGFYINLLSSQIVVNECSFGCTLYFDGCNICECNEDLSLGACTGVVCLEYQEPYCFECESNLVWTNCSDHCFVTCENTTAACSLEGCVGRCECPGDLPIYENGVCISEDECILDITTTTLPTVPTISIPTISITTTTIPLTTTCPDNCTFYFDGCNVCICTDDGLTVCTEMACEELSDAYCLQCESNMVWNDCGSDCTITCDNLDQQCDPACIARCECPSDLPVLQDNACISEDECMLCECTGEASYWRRYVRNENCEDYDTEDLCTAVDGCNWDCGSNSIGIDSDDDDSNSDDSDDDDNGN